MDRCIGRALQLHPSLLLTPHRWLLIVVGGFGMITGFRWFELSHGEISFWCRIRGVRMEARSDCVDGMACNGFKFTVWTREFL
jgi:hypothetical protein